MGAHYSLLFVWGWPMILVPPMAARSDVLTSTAHAVAWRLSTPFHPLGAPVFWQFRHLGLKFPSAGCSAIREVEVTRIQEGNGLQKYALCQPDSATTPFSLLFIFLSFPFCFSFTPFHFPSISFHASFIFLRFPFISFPVLSYTFICLSFPFVSFHVFSCSFHFLSFPFMSFHFPSISFRFLAFPFIFFRFPFIFFRFLLISFNFPFVPLSISFISFHFLPFPSFPFIFLSFHFIVLSFPFMLSFSFHVLRKRNLRETWETHGNTHVPQIFDTWLYPTYIFLGGGLVLEILFFLSFFHLCFHFFHSLLVFFMFLRFDGFPLFFIGFPGCQVLRTKKMIKSKTEAKNDKACKSIMKRNLRET